MKYHLPRILVFGATGRTGRMIVKRLLKGGYEVTAFVRNPKKLDYLNHANFRQVEGSIHSYTDVLNAVQDHEFVISALGTSRVLPNTIISRGVLNIVMAMKVSGVKNLIYQSSLGVGETKGQLGIFYNFVLLPFLLWFVFKDKERQEAIISGSDLDWIIVRPAHFIPFPLSKAYRIILPPKRPRVLPIMSRQHTADFIVKQCDTAEFSKQKISLSYF